MFRMIEIADAREGDCGLRRTGEGQELVHLVGRDVARLARVDRALEKITEGTYGLSDVSGKQIPEQRLEVMPDAINTVDEQEASERAG